MKKNPNKTPNSQIIVALRRLFLRSRERSAVLKRDVYTCQKCSSKQSKARGKEIKVEVHHKEGIPNWDEMIVAIRKHLLCSPDKMEVNCKKCHK